MNLPRIFTTIPPSSAFEASEYPDHVGLIGRWSEEAGAEGALVYTDNGLLDPWTVAQLLMERTEYLAPLVAVQPVYMPPYAVAKKIASLASLYGRKVALNMVAGGFVRDLAALGDTTPHDERYTRLADYCRVIDELLRGSTVTRNGPYHTLQDLSLIPGTPDELRPDVFVSGSSEAGAAAARSLDAIAVSYPPPPEKMTEKPAPGSFARLGILARETAGEAWQIAHARFPKDPRGRMAHRLATATSDSVWHKALSELGQELEKAPESLYWLHPFQTYRTFCPYIVGDHESVGEVLARYREAGFAGFILDVPMTAEDLPNTVEAFRRSESMNGRPGKPEIQAS